MHEILNWPPELLNKKLVAYILSTSERNVSQLVSEKRLIPVNDGGKWLKFRLTDVREYIASLPEKHPR